MQHGRHQRRVERGRGGGVDARDERAERWEGKDVCGLGVAGVDRDVDT